MKCPLRVGLLSPGRSNCHCTINNSLGLINAALPKAQDSKRLNNVYFTRSVQNIRHYDIDTNKNMILPVLSIRITIAEVLVVTNNQWIYLNFPLLCCHCFYTSPDLTLYFHGLRVHLFVRK